jgi:biotin carboxyl carrier protein
MMSDYTATVNSKKYRVIVNKTHVKVNGSDYNYELIRANNSVYLLKVGNKIYEITVNDLGAGRFGILVEGEYFETKVKTRLREQAEEFLKNKTDASNKGVLKAPMPGLVVKINFSEGESVNAGDILVVLEAMKMENNLKSVLAGTVKDIRFKEGDNIEKDDIIMTVE